MRKGQKSKGHARGGKHQSTARGESQSLQGAHASAKEEGASASAAQGTGKKTGSTSQSAASTELTCRDPFTKKTSTLLQFLLEKHEKRESIVHADMQKLFSKKDKPHFSGILRRASKQLELIYGLELKQDDSKSLSYSFVPKHTLTVGENLTGIYELPKKGLLMSILGVIFMYGNCVAEEEVWEFLNVLGIYAGNRHSLFGEPRRLITREMVQQNYLEYRQVSGSAPPRYEFLWGPRAHAETTKMQVLEVLAQIRGATPTAFPNLYEEALGRNPGRAGRRAPAAAGRAPQTKVHARCKSTDYSHI